jgi:hypothetical protein
MSRPARCRHGEPLAVDGTACYRCERDRSRCTICGERLAEALVNLGLRTHALCEPVDQADETDPRTVPWWQR